MACIAAGTGEPAVCVTKDGSSAVLDVSSVGGSLSAFYDAVFGGIVSLPEGGRVRIRREVADSIPYGRKGIGAMLMLADLEYRCEKGQWWTERDSNSRPHACKACDLTC